MGKGGGGENGPNNGLAIVWAIGSHSSSKFFFFSYIFFSYNYCIRL